VSASAAWKAGLSVGRVSARASRLASRGTATSRTGPADDFLNLRTARRPQDSECVVPIWLESSLKLKDLSQRSKTEEQRRAGPHKRIR
jgi:hypothetical protein